jgi:hypothetical protein
MTNATKDDEMICGLTADERDVLQSGLKELTDTMPPRIVWERIVRQATAEGLIRATTPRRSAWFGGFAIAATVVLAVFAVPKFQFAGTPDALSSVPPATAQNELITVTPLQALMVQSRQLESDLRALPEEPLVMRASTVATIAELESAVAAIDFQLNDAGVQMTPEETELFWCERVRLMKTLVQLRYAQTQRTAF